MSTAKRLVLTLSLVLGVGSGPRVSADGESFQRLKKRGEALLAKGDYPGALGAWQQALKLRPRDVTLLNNIGIAHTRQKVYAKASQTFARALEIDKGNPKTHFNIALLYLHQDKRAAAVEMLHRTLECADWYPETHYHLGLIFESQGRYEDAVAEYVKELNVTGSAKAYYRLRCLQRDSRTSRRRMPRPVFYALIGIFVAAVLAPLVVRARRRAASAETSAGAESEAEQSEDSSLGS